MRVVVAMSGGVDSSVAAALLAEEGHDVVGADLRTGVEPGPAAARGKQGCCGSEDAADAARVADLLGVPFYALDFAQGFDALVEGFARDYARGRTPNPCVLCNRDLKLGRLAQFARAIGAERVATGHYARRAEAGGRHALRVPRDAAKDQTYVLFPLSQEQLASTLFPLGELTKAEVRAQAARRGLPVSEKPESMEICFVPGGDYREVLRERAPEALVPGEVVDEETGAVVGRHRGAGSVTLGQRRGVGVALGEPRYVTGVDAAANVVRVGRRPGLERHVVRVEAWNEVAAALPAAGQELRGRAKVRRNHESQVATARRAAGGERGGALAVEVTFDRPVSAPAPGQALVLYGDDGLVLGGGWIASSS